MEILYICITVVVLTVSVLLYLFYTRPFTDEILETLRLHNDSGSYFKEILTIERTYKSGQRKIIHKHVNY